MPLRQKAELPRPSDESGLVPINEKNPLQSKVSMYRTIISIVLFSALVSLSFLSGCAKNPEGRVAVSGKITFDGEPLPSASISFVPTSKTINTRAGAITDASGSFSIEKLKGLAPGEYSVSIYASKSIDPKTKQEAGPDANPDTLEVHVLTPPKYNDRTEERFTVTAKGPNVYQCDVKSQ